MNRQTLLLAALIALGSCSLTKPVFPINYDYGAALTEEGRIRSAYISKAGTYLKNGVHVNCCGAADAYEADETSIDTAGNTYAVITCNDPDNCKAVEGKIVRAPGSKYLVPPDKVLAPYDPVNNTGHGWVYIVQQGPDDSSTGGDPEPAVICWAAPGGF
jgi:hypothetical protein